tara:strand:+ start:586 stop:1011 length:426 start_codon:yes stop_codon:yes gene_type:complete
MEYKRDNNKIYLSIDKDEYINISLLEVCKQNNVKFAWINGIGAILDPEVGYYNIDTKDYIKKTFSGDFELVSLVGNITYKEGQPLVHSHITFTDINFNAFGGHLFDCKISAAGEFIITVGDKKVSRSYNEDIGLFLWNCKL